MAIPCVIAIFVVTAWAAVEAGQPPTHWYPGALVIIALLVLAATTLPVRVREVPRPVLVALGLMLAFTAWSFLSITWADAKGAAWDGANRTLLYAVVFALFGLWRQRSGAATVIVSTWIFAIAVVAAVTLVKTGTADGLSLFREARLREPAGYANATAALFLMPAWPALLLAARREIHWVARGLLGGAAMLLAGVGLLSLSRGSVFSAPIMLVLVFLFVPGRARTFAALVPVAIGFAACLPVVLDVSDSLRARETASALDPLLPTIGLASIVVALVIAGGAYAEGRITRPEVRRTAHRAVSAAGLLSLFVVVVAGLAIAGNPFQRAGDAWDSFKQGYSDQPGQPLTQGLGSGRYDYYTVALNLFQDHPIRGVGVDNFQEDYLAQRTTDESPTYPHSIEMRTLAQTGLVGALLLLGFMAAALSAAVAAMRRGTPLGRGVAAAGVAAFAYWVLHGSFDWFWEFAGLGVPAFAMLGLACGLAPRQLAAPVRRSDRPLLPRVAVGVALIVAVFSIVFPWLSDLSTNYAATNWQQNPAAAYQRLDRAASLDPLSPDPHLIAGTIALRRSELARAQTEFRAALDREPRSAYATLELGAIASVYERPIQAERLLTRATTLDPRDELARGALRDVISGRQVNIDRLNEALLDLGREIR